MLFMLLLYLFIFLIYVGYWKEKLKRINTDLLFLGLIEILSATVVALIYALFDFLKEIGIKVKKCVGLGTDEASNMVAIHNSLYARLREKTGNLACTV